MAKNPFQCSSRKQVVYTSKSRIMLYYIKIQSFGYVPFLKVENFFNEHAGARTYDASNGRFPRAPAQPAPCNIPDVKKQLKLDHEASSSINIK
jgi:hypothetical protein